MIVIQEGVNNDHYTLLMFIFIIDESNNVHFW